MKTFLIWCLFFFFILPLTCVMLQKIVERILWKINCRRGKHKFVYLKRKAIFIKENCCDAKIPKGCKHCDLIIEGDFWETDLHVWEWNRHENCSICKRCEEKKYERESLPGECTACQGTGAHGGCCPVCGGSGESYP